MTGGACASRGARGSGVWSLPVGPRSLKPTWSCPLRNLSGTSFWLPPESPGAVLNALYRARWMALATGRASRRDAPPVRPSPRHRQRRTALAQRPQEVGGVVRVAALAAGAHVVHAARQRRRPHRPSALQRGVHAVITLFGRCCARIAVLGLATMGFAKPRFLYWGEGLGAGRDHDLA